MNNISLLLKKIFVLAVLMVFFLPSFSQIRGLKAVNDTMDLYPGIPLVYDILANDTIPANVTIKLIAFIGLNHISFQRNHDSTWKWTFTFTPLNWGFGGEVHGTYRLYTMSMDTTSAEILFRIHDKSYGYLDINNVSARFSSSGLHFFYDSAEFVVPKGSGKTSIFSNSLWIGGLDGQKQLHFAGERYRQGPTIAPAWTKPDFYSGPIMDSVNYSIYQDTVWNYIWNVKKSEIDYHRAHFWEPGYTPIHDILTWPGNGNTALGQAPRLAPFSDRNANGIYEPYDGDYPEIRGDQALFFIFNDDRGPHLESQGAKLRIEIHGMAYAFDIPGDSAFNNTVFLNYKIYNRSQETYDSTLLGIFSDIDLGYANDDYVGCDVERNMYFGYNGTPVDGTGQSYAYGANPPAQGVTLLAGPYMDPDGIDNPRYSNSGSQLCDFSVNGLNFGDSIVDNERLGLQRHNFYNGGSSFNSDPNYAPEYYLFMNLMWNYGAGCSTNGYGPACRFIFPGESDTLNWGVGCTPPNGPVNWTEETVGCIPGDRRSVGVTGPFTFHPGEMQEIDIMFNWARDYVNPGPLSSIGILRQRVDWIRKAFTENKLPNGNPFYGISDNMNSPVMRVGIYPNPASDHINIDLGASNQSSNTTLELMTSQANCIKKIIMTDHMKPVHFDVSDIPSGFYFIRITTKESMMVRKVVIMH